MTGMCPHCGFNLEADRPIELDGFHVDPRGHVQFDGADIAMPPASKEILAALAKAHPRPVSRDVLIERLGIESQNARRTLDVHIANLRGSLREAGLPQPVQRVWAYGYRWEI